MPAAPTVFSLAMWKGSSSAVLGIDDAHLLDEHPQLAVHQVVHRQLATVIDTARNGEPAPDASTGLWKDQLLARFEVQPLSHAPR